LPRTSCEQALLLFILNYTTTIFFYLERASLASSRLLFRHASSKVFYTTRTI